MQYPHEAEITFPPLTHIEILHEGRVKEVDGRPVLVMSGKLSVNIKSLSREQLVAQVRVFVCVCVRARACVRV